ncbi:HU family DNA-binding protein, partial [Oleiphilus sp. HI0080]
MKKPELIAAIAEETGLTKDKSGEVLNALLDEITNAMTR